MRTVVEVVSDLADARGVALYGTLGDAQNDRARLGAVGSAIDLPEAASAEDLSRLVRLKGATVLPLVVSGVEIGTLLVDLGGSTPRPGVEITRQLSHVADLAAIMLSLNERREATDERLPVFGTRQFRTLAERTLTLAERHGRRACVLAIAGGERASRRDDIALEISDIVRTTDALSTMVDGELLVFLPETTALGAHACRRRIGARLSGDRRARPRGMSRTDSARGGPSGVRVGVASFPHDGATLARLVEVARARADIDGRSTVFSLGLETLDLGEIVDALLARPMVDAGQRSPCPLDLASSALFGLVGHACREAMRSGPAAILTTLQPGLGVAAAARQAAQPRVLDIRSAPDCSDLEAIVIEAEHGAWVCCGRVRDDRFRGIHAADPRLADLLAARISAAGGPHAG